MLAYASSRILILCLACFLIDPVRSSCAGATWTTTEKYCNNGFAGEGETHIYVHDCDHAVSEETCCKAKCLVTSKDGKPCVAVEIGYATQADCELWFEDPPISDFSVGGGRCFLLECSPTSAPSPAPTRAPHTSAPTPSPTRAPHTSSPTPFPTHAPHTSSPTPFPTRVPHTSAPTPSPTRAPHTSSPTPFPTRVPHTSAPTPSPTRVPHTSSPTPSPTRVPHTSSPTPSPTRTPHTSTPTPPPTRAPTAASLATSQTTPIVSTTAAVDSTTSSSVSTASTVAGVTSATPPTTEFDATNSKVTDAAGVATQSDPKVSNAPGASAITTRSDSDSTSSQGVSVTSASPAFKVTDPTTDAATVTVASSVVDSSVDTSSTSDTTQDPLQNASTDKATSSSLTTIVIVIVGVALCLVVAFGVMFVRKRNTKPAPSESPTALVTPVMTFHNPSYMDVSTGKAHVGQRPTYDTPNTNDYEMPIATNNYNAPTATNDYDMPIATNEYNTLPIATNEYNTLPLADTRYELPIGTDTSYEMPTDKCTSYEMPTAHAHANAGENESNDGYSVPITVNQQGEYNMPFPAQPDYCQPQYAAGDFNNDAHYDSLGYTAATDSLRKPKNQQEVTCASTTPNTPSDLYDAPLYSQGADGNSTYAVPLEGDDGVYACATDGTLQRNDDDENYSMPLANDDNGNAYDMPNADDTAATTTTTTVEEPMYHVAAAHTRVHTHAPDGFNGKSPDNASSCNTVYDQASPDTTNKASAVYEIASSGAVNIVHNNINRQTAQKLLREQKDLLSTSIRYLVRVKDGAYVWSSSILGKTFLHERITVLNDGTFSAAGQQASSLAELAKSLATVMQHKHKADVCVAVPVVSSETDTVSRAAFFGFQSNPDEDEFA